MTITPEQRAVIIDQITYAPDTTSGEIRKTLSWLADQGEDFARPVVLYSGDDKPGTPIHAAANAVLLMNSVQGETHFGQRLHEKNITFSMHGFLAEAGELPGVEAGWAIIMCAESDPLAVIRNKSQDLRTFKWADVASQALQFKLPQQAAGAGQPTAPHPAFVNQPTLTH